MSNVSFEIQSLLLRIREYKKSKNATLSPQFSRFFQEANLSILGYFDEDEDVQVAIVNFYSKLTYCPEIQKTHIY